MLEELDIKDFALIEHVKVSWTRGLNVLTGETGAGKSILIDALNAVLGGKMGPSVIRNGADKATIEAVFKQNPEITAWLKQQELLSDEQDGLIVAREINKSGSRVRINGTLVNLNLLQELRQKLLTLHAQHEARTLMLPQAQLDMLDALGDKGHKKLQEKVRTLHAQRRDLQLQLKELQISEEERLRRLDFARFQLKELEDAELKDADEFDSISGQCKVLSHVVHLQSASSRAHECLSGADGSESSCAVDMVQDALVEIEKAADLDSKLQPIADSLRGCADTLDEVSRELRRYRDSLDLDPESLADLESRLNLLAGIKRKYGPELTDAITRRDELAAEVSRLDNAQSAIEQLQHSLSAVEEEWKESSQDLSNRRKELSIKLASRIQSELADLGMERCRFEIAFEEAEPSPSGTDRIEFLIAPNPGQPLAAVSKIASGGELSRVMLAVKSIFAEADRVATVVFDEIDTGLSGKVLQSMRDKLARLARSHQILCITHQPIIASVADNHILIDKQQSASSTHVTAVQLREADRVKSLAGMASGKDNQAEALQFAQSLFDEGQRVRNR